MSEAARKEYERAQAEIQRQRDTNAHIMRFLEGEIAAIQERCGHEEHASLPSGVTQNTCPACGKVLYEL